MPPPYYKRIWPFTWMESPYFVYFAPNLFWLSNAVVAWERSKAIAIVFLLCVCASIPMAIEARRGRSWRYWLWASVYLSSLAAGIAGNIAMTVADHWK
ncbi:MAG TPA: hypothetical protein VNH11_09680 [Pirellulales bacterium]|nr:hypothetical protein [Pirellulales bacterium]